MIKWYLRTPLSVCQPVGVADPDRIPNAQMTASSYYSSSYYPHYGRLNEARGNGGWCPNTRQGPRTDYLQVDLGTVHSVCAVATQGAIATVTNAPQATFCGCLKMESLGIHTKRTMPRRWDNKLSMQSATLSTTINLGYKEVRPS